MYISHFDVPIYIHKSMFHQKSGRSWQRQQWDLWLCWSQKGLWGLLLKARVRVWLQKLIQYSRHCSKTVSWPKSWWVPFNADRLFISYLMCMEPCKHSDNLPPSPVVPCHHNWWQKMIPEQSTLPAPRGFFLSTGSSYPGTGWATAFLLI